MLVEDRGLELFNVEDVMLIKNIKILLEHLQCNHRIGIHIKINLTHAQILSGEDKCILQDAGSMKQFWKEEIAQQFFQLGGIINIKHWIPSLLITGEITIM